MSKKRKTPRVKNVTIYLGKDEERERRVNHIRQLAKHLTGDDSLSRFVQKLGDGEFDKIFNKSKNT